MLALEHRLGLLSRLKAVTGLLDCYHWSCACRLLAPLIAVCKNASE